MRNEGYIHKTREGRQIPLSEMLDHHLLNTIKAFLSKARQGVILRSGGGSDGDFYYDEEEVVGLDYLKHVGFQYYLAEYVARGNDITWIRERMIKIKEEG